MGRYINPFTDVGFKRIFGQELSKPLLLHFLNSLLEGERRITNITLVDKEQVGVYDEDRSLIYDILCETETQEKIIVEMQNREHPNFKERMLYYASQAIARQGEKGSEWGYDIKAVYLVAFTNFTLSQVQESFRIDIGVCDMRTGKLFTDKMRLIFLQLPLFTRDPDDCETDFERWIYVLKNMETLNRLPWAAKNSVFQRLSEIADVASLNKEERMKYDSALKKYRDTLIVMQGAEMKGRAEGIKERNLSVARKMKEEGLDDGMISRITGLTAEQITNI